MNIQVLPVEGLPEVRPGDDLASLLAGPLGAIGLGNGDVVAVTQKIVSKAEGRVVPGGDGGRDAWVERETRRVVARRGDLVIAETRHGFVCANAGVDASNVEEGFLTLLPEGPAAPAERLPRPPGRGAGGGRRGARRRGGRRERARDGQGGAGAGRDRPGRRVRAGIGTGVRDGPPAGGGSVPDGPAPVDLGTPDDPGVRGRRGGARG